MSLVTVIVPVADAHRFLLPRAIHSLKQQTYSPEILIVNDSAQPLAIGGATILETGGNKGSAYARNLGLDKVKTPLVTFLDADDYFLDTAIEVLTKGYLEYDTCYVYSDWYQYTNNKTYTRFPTKPHIYDRMFLLKHSLHLVNILIETDVAKSVYYDINYRGWEDWAFHIALGEKGYCGTRIPEPLLIYDMTTSINRVKHDKIQDEVYKEIHDKYSDYLKGVKEFMACQSCGGGKMKQQQQLSVLPPSPVEGLQTLEFLGQNTAPIRVRVNNHVYSGANDDAFKFIQVPYEDVQGLLERGSWRKVVRSSKPVELPQPEEFNGWRAVNSQPIPVNIQDFFKKDAVIIKDRETVEEPKRRTRRTKAQMEAARNALLNDTVLSDS